VCWPEYVHQLLNAVWISLPDVLTFFKQLGDSDLRKWTEVSHIRLQVVTLDVLWLQSRMQVVLQHDSCTDFDISRESTLPTDNLMAPKTNTLIGGTIKVCYKTLPTAVTGDDVTPNNWFVQGISCG
jgi:hypothetical protein